MKYKNKLERLRMKQNWWEKLPESDRRASGLTRKPGSIKTA